MPRPILLGIVGDSGAGKTTLTRGLVRILGATQVTHIPADHYHRFDRAQRAELGLSPLHPDGNYLDILEQHLGHLRAGEPVMKPVYRHQDGTLGPAETGHPRPVHDRRGPAGLPHRLDARRLRRPGLRRSARGPAAPLETAARLLTPRVHTDEVLAELDRREADAEAFVHPQRRHADLVISFMPGDRGDPEHLDARVTMRPGLAHPDLAPLVHGNGITLDQRGADTVLWIPGTIDPERSAAVEEAIWDRLHFASHLRTERLGEFTVGTELHRSEPLAITQLLVLYQVVTARAAVSLGASGARLSRA